MGYDAMIFDMDGTLIDSEFIMQEAWNTVLKPFNVFIDEERYKDFCGLRSIELIPGIIKTYDLPIDLVEFQKQLKQVVIDWIDNDKNEIPIMYGAIHILENFKKVNIPLAVATSTRTVLATKKLKATALAKYFSVVVAGDEVKNSKPAPDIYKAAYQRLVEIYGNIDSVMCFEDSEPGVKSAVDAGFDCIAIPNKFTNNQDFSLAKYVFPNLMIAMERVR